MWSKTNKTPPKVIPKTGRREAQRTVLKDNDEATILAKVKYLGE